MAFTLSRIHSSVTDYKSALIYWNACRPWRGESGDFSRPLINPRKRHMSVNMHHSGNIAFQLHGTEVVTYTPDDKLILRVYASQSTSVFANSFAPATFTACFHSGFIRWSHIMAGEWIRLYRAEHGDTVTIDLNADTVEGTTPWARYVVDRKRANAIRKESRIAEVKLFVRAADTLRVPVPEGPRWRWDMHEAAEVLADQSRWGEFRSLTGRHALAQLEGALLRRGGALVVPEPEPYLRDWTQIMAYERSWKAYGKPLHNF